jgi:tetratricopeptide (TPR) repeat protein
MWLSPLLAFLLLAQGADPVATGMKALEAQKYEEAAAAFRQAVAADAGDYAAHFHLALSLSLLERDAEAIPEYRKTLELKPGLYQAELNLGMLLLRGKQAAEAVKALEAAQTAKPAEYRPNFYLGEALLQVKEPARAEAAYRKALAGQADSAAAEAGLARALAGQARLAEAAPHFEKAAALDAAYNDGLLELAELYEKAGKTDEAVALYQKFPDNAAARERAGRLLLVGGKTGDAIPALEAAVATSPTPANRAALAAAYIRAKKIELAIAQLGAASAAEPGNLELKMAYGRALRDGRHYQPAAIQFRDVVKAQPGSKDAWSELAAMLILIESYPSALAALDKVQALGGEGAGLYYLRGLVHDRMKEYEEAEAAYEKFLEMSQNRSPDEEFKARQRLRVIKKELSRR